ncbi:MAG: hypothetical protein ACFCD0_00465 [Gemmataceae bacterium]
MLFAYVNMVPVYLIGNLLIAIVLVRWAAARRSGVWRIAVLACVLTTSVVFWTTFLVYTDVQQRKTFDMIWSCGKKSPAHPKADHIVLRFESNPNHHIGIYSDDLGKYLKTLPTKEVQVEVDVILDFGKTRGFELIRIGELYAWNELDGYSGVSGGSPGASPFP